MQLQTGQNDLFASHGPIKPYHRGRYRVDIASDGAIKVKRGDWLSKYSYAMYGDFKHIGEFGRIDDHGVLAPVENPDRIEEDELLYHIPTYNLSHLPCPPPVPLVTPSKPAPPESSEQGLSDQEIKQKIDELQNEYHVSSEALETISLFAEGLGRLAEVVEMFELVSWAGIPGGALCVVGIPLGVISMWERFDAQQKMTAARAIAYATTAWAFNEPVPSFSKTLERNILAGGGRGKEELIESRQTWNSAAHATFARLDARIAEKKVSKQVAQHYLQASGENDRRKLCGKLLREMDEYMVRGVLEAWRSMHGVVYPEPE